MAIARLELSDTPYPGLRPFRPDEADIFFGRERQTDELLSRLGEHRFLAVVGPSGCGKSSLVEAGMRPALATGFMAKAGAHWRVAYLRPGGRPLQNLAKALLDAGLLDAERAGQPDAQVFLEAVLRRGPLGLVEIVRDSALEPDENLLVIVDQFEELFRFSAGMDRNEAEAFVALLLASASAQGERIYVTITMRSDYIGECTPFHGLPEAINDGLYLTPRLTREECESCITGPARVFGGDVEPALVNRLLNDFGPDPDQLPLLQHALLRMWNRHEQERAAGQPTLLRTGDYDGTGGLTRSLSDHTNEAFAELDATGQRVAELMFRRLSDAETARRDRRAPARVEEIAALAGVEIADVIRVADAFRRPDRCFLMPPTKVELKPGTILDVSHESLLRQWDRAVGWLKEEAEAVGLYRKLQEAAPGWKQGEVLMSASSLDRAVDWRKQASAAWARRYGTEEEFATVCAFIEASEHDREAKRSQERRTRVARKRRWVAAIALGAVAIVSTGALLVRPLFFEWERTSYYASYATRYGEPYGIGKQLTKAQVRHRTLTFHIVKAGLFGRVKRIEAVNSRGEPTQSPSEYQVVARGHRLATTRWEYDYDADGNIASEHQYTNRKELVQSKVFLPGQSAAERHAIYIGAERAPAPVRDSSGNAYFWAEKLHYSKSDRTETISYLGSSGEPAQGRDRAYATKHEYDERGYLVSMTSLDRAGKPMNDAAGNSIFKITKHDELGNPLEAIVLDKEARPTKVDDGWTIFRAARDEWGNQIEEAYFDEHGRPVAIRNGWHKATTRRDRHGSVTEVRFFDPEGRPTHDVEDACYGTAQQRDAMDRVTAWTCLDAEGASKRNRHGYVMWMGKYDHAGRLTEQTFRDADGRPTTGANGYAGVHYAYDGWGRATAITYQGVDGRPVNSSEGYAGSRTRHDDEARVEWTHFLDVDGKPARARKGHASVKRARDVLGNIIEERYFGQRGEAVIISAGYAGWRAVLDAQGQQIEMFYLGKSGEPVLDTEGTAGWKAEYDELGRKTAVHYLDFLRKPVANAANGIAGWRSRFDQWDREIEQLYFGLDGRPAISFQGEAGWRAEYDARGNQTMRRYVDLAGAPALHSWDENKFSGVGYAMVRSAFDPHGNRLEEAYFGVHGERVAKPERWSRAKHEYDDRRRLVRSAYFGTKDERVKIRRGYHAVAHVYDDPSHTEEIRYLDLDGESLVTGDKGFARIVMAYDPYGRVVEKSVYGTAGERTTWAGGTIHRTVATWDAHGRPTRDELWGKQDPPDRLGATEYRYDGWGNEVGRRHLGPDGKLRATVGKCAAEVWRFGERQELLEVECRGADEALAPHLEGGAARIVYAYDQLGRRIQDAYYNERGLPFTTQLGFAAIMYKYDALGRETEVAYTDAAGRQVVTGLSYARMTMAYDLRGDRIEEAYFLADDRPVQDVAKMESEFDALRRKTRDRYLGPGGQPALLSKNGQHITLYEYDDFGKVRELRYLDGRGQPTRGYARFFDESWARCGRWVARYGADGTLQGGDCQQALPPRLDPDRR